MATKIHVRNVGSDVRPGEIEQLFARFGVVREVVMVMRSESTADGPGAIVGMGSEEECRAVVRSLGGTPFHGAFLDLRAVQTNPEPALAEAQMFGPMNMSDGVARGDDQRVKPGQAAPPQAGGEAR